MPEFEYIARNQKGERVTGTAVAADPDHLYSLLRSSQLYLLSSKTVERTRRVPPRRLKRADLINFTIQLSNILAAGVPINQGLSDIASVAQEDWFKALVLDLQHGIEREGLSLSEAMARHPKIFSRVYVSVVRAGEFTGNVEQCLDDLARFIEWQDKLVKDIRQATIYPILVLSVIAVLSVILLTFVFPRFMAVMVQLNATELPLPTRVVMTASEFLKSAGGYLAVLLLAAVVAVRVAIRFPKGRLLWDRFKLSLPVVGELVRKVALTRFANYFAMLSKAGVDVITTISIVQEVMGNAVLAQVVREARGRVLEGASLSESLAESGEFPPLVIRMVHLGETTGEIDRALERVKEFYDREVSRTVGRIFAFMEPALLVVVASVVLFIALALYLPMWNILDQIGTR